MGWESREIDRVRVPGPPMALQQYQCPSCGRGQFAVFGYGSSAQLHLYCLSCDEVVCFHGAACVAQFQSWVMVDAPGEEMHGAQLPGDGGE